MNNNDDMNINELEDGNANKTMEKVTLLTASKVCNQLDISNRTLDNWYRFYNNSDIKKPSKMPVLPQYIQKSVRGPRYWKPEDIPQLKKFKKWVPKGRYGVMGAVNEKYWAKDKRKNSGGHTESEVTAKNTENE